MRRRAFIAGLGGAARVSQRYKCNKCNNGPIYLINKANTCYSTCYNKMRL